MKTADILQEVKAAYSAIAHEFDATRNRPWPEFKIFLKEMKKHFINVCERTARARSEANNLALPVVSQASYINRRRLATLGVLDIGCGNGRLLPFLTLRQAQGDIKPFTYTGIDNNPAMIRIAKKKHPGAKFRLAEALSLPFPARSFDAVFCIAMLHHLPAASGRKKALAEMKRVLKKNGILILTVWNLLSQKKYKKYIDPKTHDGEIPWGPSKKHPRYYHAFTRAELSSLLKTAGFHKIKTVKSRHNIAIIAAHEKN